jgi:hypothetical protein
LRPALRKIDVLGMRDLQRRVEWGEPQRHDEFAVANLFRGLRGDGDFVANSLLLHAVRRGHQQDLGGLRADGVFEDAFPVIAAAQAQHVGEHLIAERGQLRAEPQREGVVLGTRVTDEQRLARWVAHVRFLIRTQSERLLGQRKAISRLCKAMICRATSPGSQP